MAHRFKSAQGVNFESNCVCSSLFQTPCCGICLLFYCFFLIELGNMLSENVNLSPRANLTMSFTIELNMHDYANLSKCSQIWATVQVFIVQTWSQFIFHCRLSFPYEKSVCAGKSGKSTRSNKNDTVRQQYSSHAALCSAQHASCMSSD